LSFRHSTYEPRWYPEDRATNVILAPMITAPFRSVIRPAIPERTFLWHAQALRHPRLKL
jgi:hypothetical protein